MMSGIKLAVLSGFGICVLSVTGCGALSATSLRCGTDGDTSYVEVVSAPQSLSQNTRALSELCAFAYEESDDG